VGRRPPLRHAPCHGSRPRRCSPARRPRPPRGRPAQKVSVQAHASWTQPHAFHAWEFLESPTEAGRISASSKVSDGAWCRRPDVGTVAHRTSCIPIGAHAKAERSVNSPSRRRCDSAGQSAQGAGLTCHFQTRERRIIVSNSIALGDRRRGIMIALIRAGKLCPGVIIECMTPPSFHSFWDSFQLSCTILFSNT
jgi:hypothetical protein